MLEKPDILSSLRVTSSSPSSSSSSPEIRRIPNEICYLDFFVEYLVPNKPCVFGPWLTDSWKCRKEWVIPHRSPPQLRPSQSCVILDRGKEDRHFDDNDSEKEDDIDKDNNDRGDNDEENNDRGDNDDDNNDTTRRIKIARFLIRGSFD